MNYDEIKFSVRIKYMTLISGIIVTIISIILYINYVPQSNTFPINEKINSIIQIFGVGIALTTLIYVAVNQNFVLKSKLEENLQQKKKYSSDLMRIWSTKEMFEFASIARKVWYNREEKGDTQYVEEIINNESTYVAIISILNFFEQISQLIDENVVDDKMMKKYYYQVVQNYRERYSPLIQFLRKQDKNELILSDFEKLATRWYNESIK